MEQLVLFVCSTFSFVNKYVQPQMGICRWRETCWKSWTGKINIFFPFFPVLFLARESIYCKISFFPIFPGWPLEKLIFDFYYLDAKNFWVANAHFPLTQIIVPRPFGENLTKTSPVLKFTDCLYVFQEKICMLSRWADAGCPTPLLNPWLGVQLVMLATQQQPQKDNCFGDILRMLRKGNCFEKETTLQISIFSLHGENALWAKVTVQMQCHQNIGCNKSWIIHCFFLFIFFWRFYWPSPTPYQQGQKYPLTPLIINIRMTPKITDWSDH